MLSKTSRVISSKARNLAKSRESSVPMNMPHTDLTNLTKGASLRPRLSASPSVFSRMVHTSVSDVCFREIREICVRPKSAMKENFARFARLPLAPSGGELRFA